MCILGLFHPVRSAEQTAFMPAPLGTVSHYELLRRVGAGGMGEVYLARDTVLQRQVAIKFLHDADAGDPESARRLRRDAQAAAALDHPNICAIYEVGAEDGGRSFIVMQYVEGETLASRIRRGVTDPPLTRIGPSSPAPAKKIFLTK